MRVIKIPLREGCATLPARAPNKSFTCRRCSVCQCVQCCQVLDPVFQLRMRLLGRPGVAAAGNQLGESLQRVPGRY